MGDYCSTWDNMMDYCAVDAPADWCTDAWCYVPEGCPGASVESYFTDIEGETLYFSYEHCGSDDTYTGSEDDPYARR